jgi:hypothetical protein
MMALLRSGFTLVSLPPVPEAVSAVFGGLSPTVSTAPRNGRLRMLRLRMSWTADDDWLFESLPPGPGGAPADRRLVVGVSGLLRRALGGPWLGIDDDWLIDLHWVRAVAPTRSVVQVRVPGPRPESCTFKLVAVAGCRGGGVSRSRLFGPARPGPLADVALTEGQGVLMDRLAVTEDAHDLIAGADGPGVLDLVAASISRCAPAPAMAHRVA